MKYSGIGGQAVMEGVMMRNGKKYATSVRKPDKTIETSIQESGPVDTIWHKIPIIRGVISFVDSLVIGMKTLTYSASFFEDEEEENDKKKKPKKELTEEQKAKREKAEMGGTVMLSLVLALGIFFVLPYYISTFLNRYIDNDYLMALIEGVLRLAIFIGYVIAIRQMEDIKRTFMYHGAEHKCINCIEAGDDLVVENVRKASRQHKRCGTSFIFIVMLISIFVFMFIRFDTVWLKLVCRLLLIPVIAGVSYEFIRLAGRTENKVVGFLSKPGMWVQNMTTAEPTDDMIEVAIASVEAVFDWKEFVKEVREDNK